MRPDPDAARIVGTAANAIGAFAKAAPLLVVAAAGLRDQGRLGLLARALTQQAWSAVHRVDLSVAIPVSEEAERLTRETAQPTMRHITRAIQARPRHCAATVRPPRRMPQRPSNTVSQSAHVRCWRWHSTHAGSRPRRRRPRPGVRAASPHPRSQRPSYHSFMRSFTLADLVDAATRSGQRDAVRPIVLEMQAMAEAAPVPALHASLHYSKPLLADADAAEPLFEAALHANRPGRSCVPGHRSPSGSGSGATGGSQSRGNLCAMPATSSMPSGPFPGVSGLGRNSGPPARRAAAVRLRHANS